MSFFHYATYKYITICDSRLGIGYYFTAFLIIIFTFTEIFLSKGYLEYDTHPVGTLRLLLSDPPHDFFHEKPPSECCINKTADGECLSQCRYLDAQELSWPIQSRTLSMMTFCKERWQINQQSTEHPEKFETVREGRFFTLKPEEYVVKVEHSIVATKFFSNSKHGMVAGSQRNMKGWLLDFTGKRIREMKKGADKLTIRELLSASGVDSLDQVSDALNANGKSFRRHGLVLHVTIKYTNTEETWFGTGLLLTFGTWFGTSPLQYGYHISRIPFADYRLNELNPIFDAESMLENVSKPKARLLRKRYGVKIEFHQIGMLGKFSLACLMVKLASGMGLLTLTATIVDTFALYILPDRLKYRSYVYETSASVEKDIKQD